MKKLTVMNERFDCSPSDSIALYEDERIGNIRELKCPSMWSIEACIGILLVSFHSSFLRICLSFLPNTLYKVK